MAPHVRGCRLFCSGSNWVIDNTRDVYPYNDTVLFCCMKVWGVDERKWYSNEKCCMKDVVYIEGINMRDKEG